MPNKKKYAARGRPSGTPITQASINEVKRFFSIFGSMASGAKAIGVTRTAAFSWLAGSYRPSKDNAIKMRDIARERGVYLSLAKLLDDSNYSDESPKLFDIIINYLSCLCGLSKSEYIAKYLPIPVIDLLNNNAIHPQEYFEEIFKKINKKT